MTLNVFINWIRNHKKKSSLLIIFFSLLILLVIFSSFHTPLKERQKKEAASFTQPGFNEAVAMQLADMNTRLSALQQAVKNTQGLSRQTKEALSQEIEALTHASLTLAKDSSVTTLNQSVNEEKVSLLDKFSTLETLLKTLQQTLSSGDYIEASFLPFKILSIDVWNGQVYAAISLDNKQHLLTVGDSQVGWKVQALQYSPPEAVFENAKHQLIKIELGGKE